MRSVLALLLTMALLGGCKGEDPNKDARVGEGTSQADNYVCKLVNSISDCDLPPNAFSKDKVYCWGCNCAGPNPVAACNGTNGDCRFFASGCYPKTYTLCDTSAPDNILGLCGYCFFAEAGIPSSCNHLVDAGANLPKDSGAKH